MIEKAKKKSFWTRINCFLFCLCMSNLFCSFLQHYCALSDRWKWIQFLQSNPTHPTLLNNRYPLIMNCNLYIDICRLIWLQEALTALSEYHSELIFKKILCYSYETKEQNNNYERGCLCIYKFVFIGRWTKLEMKKSRACLIKVNMLICHTLCAYTFEKPCKSI